MMKTPCGIFLPHHPPDSALTLGPQTGCDRGFSEEEEKGGVGFEWEGSVLSCVGTSP